MKYLTVPEHIELFNLVTNETTGRKMSFREFVQGTLLTDKRFGKGLKELQAALRIGEAVRKVEPGVPGGLVLESTDWEILRDTAKEPSSEYLPGVAVQVIPFITAIVEHATDQPPKNGVPKVEVEGSTKPVDGPHAPVVA